MGRGQVVGFYKDHGKTKPITKSVAELNRKRFVKSGKQFKNVKPRRGAEYVENLIDVWVLEGWIPDGYSRSYLEKLYSTPSDKLAKEFFAAYKAEHGAEGTLSNFNSDVSGVSTFKKALKKKLGGDARRLATFSSGVTKAFIADREHEISKAETLLARLKTRQATLKRRRKTVKNEEKLLEVGDQIYEVKEKLRADKKHLTVVKQRGKKCIS
jgi:hypothetical protein